MESLSDPQEQSTAMANVVVVSSGSTGAIIADQEMAVNSIDSTDQSEVIPLPTMSYPSPWLFIPPHDVLPLLVVIYPSP